MKIFKFAVIFLCLNLISSAALAKMYKWVDADGNISYSDLPPYKGAEQLKAPALTTMPATAIPKKKTADATEKNAEEKPTVYSYLKITSPLDDMTVRNNSGDFSISIGSKPALDTSQGHTFSLSMDGKTLKSKLPSASINLTNIDRGTHKFLVSIQDKSGATLRKSKSITVHLHRQIAVRKQAR